MKFLCVEPVTNSGKVCSFVLSGDDYAFQIQQVCSPDSPFVARYFQDTSSQYTYLCFDALKTLGTLGLKFPFLWDVKVMYQLLGYSFHNLMDLGAQVFNAERMQKYQELSSCIKAHLNSYRVVKIDHSKFLHTDLLPANLVESFYRERSAIVLELYKEFVENADNDDVQSFYRSTMYKSVVALHTISQEPVAIDLESISDVTSHYAEAVRRHTKDGEAFLKFNAVGAKTGRLSFKKGTINLYSLPRSLRKCVVAPKHHTIVQFDFKSFQPRLAIFSTGDAEFKKRFKDVDDIYSIFPGDREKNKIGFLAWMFSQKRNEMFEQEALPIYDMRNKLYLQAKNDEKVTNIFGRVLRWRGEEKNVVFQNYITSVEVDAILGLVRLMVTALASKRSRVLFPFHDAVICLIHDDEAHLIEKLKVFMEEYYTVLLGRLPVGVKVGTNFGDLK